MRKNKIQVYIASCLTIASIFGFLPMTLAIDFTYDEHGNKTSLISDESSPILDDSVVPTRPRRLEFGSGFLESGPLKPGYELPGGAILQPSLLIFGTFRTALQTFKNPLGPGAGSRGQVAFTEWATRLDIFANLQLSATERILFGVQPLHDRDLPPTYTGYNFRPKRDARGDVGYQEEFDPELTTLFFEGDLGEMLANFDPLDFGHLDIGISLGRQPLFYQGGLLINDTVDAIGLIRNNLNIRGGSHLQFAGLFGWNEINRADNVEVDDNLYLYGFFTQMDLPFSTVNIDFVYTADNVDDNDGFHWGLSSIQRFGHYNTAFHLLGSHAVGDERRPVPGRPVAAVDDGFLFWNEVSWVLPWSEDNVYFNTFWGINNFSSAARGPDVGGPLGRHGLLFASQGLGRYTPGLSNQVGDAYGAAIGYQKFLNHSVRRQILFELGFRDNTGSVRNGGIEPRAVALLSRFQQALGQRTVFQLDAFGGLIDTDDAPGLDDTETSYGLRSEIRVAF